jgi:peptide/nickel transport system permease protein
MAATQTATHAFGSSVLPEREGQVARLWQDLRRRPVALAGGVMLLVLVLGAVLAPVVSPYDPNAQDLARARAGRPASPSSAHLWGTDQFGRDYLSRALHAARISLSVGFVAVAVSLVVGTALGSVAGYAGGRVDMAIMRFTDFMLTFPPLLILLAVQSIVARPSIAFTTVVIGLLAWMYPARLIRAELLSLREREFVLAARATGSPPWRVLVRELLPNLVGTIIVAATLGIPAAILTESSLSFLGMGVMPPTATWGNMLTQAMKFMREGAWWIGFYPGLLISLTVLSVNFIGDGLRDVLERRRL